MTFRILLAFLCCLLAAPVLAGGAIVVAVGIDKPPYVESQGQSGLEVEIARAAFLKAGYQPVFRPLPPSRGIDMLGRGQIDAMLSLAPGAQPLAYYSQPLVYYRNRAIALAGSNLTLRSLADLARYRVASFQNAHLLLGPDFERMAASLPNYAEQADQSLLNTLLYRHRVDVVLSDINIFNAFDAMQPQDRCKRPALMVVDLFPASARHAGFARSADRDAFDKALAELSASGEIDRLRQRFMPRELARVRQPGCERVP